MSLYEIPVRSIDTSARWLRVSAAGVDLAQWFVHSGVALDWPELRFYISTRDPARTFIMKATEALPKISELEIKKSRTRPMSAQQLANYSAVKAQHIKIRE